MSRTELQQAVIECQDNLEFMAGLDDGIFKLIVTSPPYNLGKSYESSRESLQVGNYVEKRRDRPFGYVSVSCLYFAKIEAEK